MNIMMRNYGLSTELVAAEQAEKMRYAERSRLVRAALKGEQGRFAVYKPLLRGLGARMVAWGMALQIRYALPLAAQPTTITYPPSSDSAVRAAR